VVCYVKCTPGGERNVLYSRGDVEQLFYSHSCLKYVQVLPLLESGEEDDNRNNNIMFVLSHQFDVDGCPSHHVHVCL
jgi:L-asparaginase II